MNQDEVKNMLVRLESQAPEFTLLFTGKASAKVNGLYKPETREILLHNKNFSSDEELVYTAVHEFAHHIHFCSASRPTSSHSHTTVYWSLFHRLLARAEQMGLYHNLFATEPEFVELTSRIKETYLAGGGALMKAFGQSLLQAAQLCGKHHVRFEDYMDRILRIPRSTAKAVMASFAQDLNPEFGFDNMKLLSGVKDPELRRDMELKAKEGFSHQMLRQELGGEPVPDIASDPAPDPVALRKASLENELAKAEARVASIKAKLEDLEKQRDAAHKQFKLGFTPAGPRA